MTMAHDSLENHVKTNFNLRQDHGWSFSEIDEMVPWERILYVELLSQKLRNENQRQLDEIMHNKRK
jgi:hypothetical protein